MKMLGQALYKLHKRSAGIPYCVQRSASLGEGLASFCRPIEEESRTLEAEFDVQDVEPPIQGALGRLAKATGIWTRRRYPGGHSRSARHPRGESYGRARLSQ